MDKSFHYYGTYVAALVAGYESEQAQTIANAAQYVDESDENLKVREGEYGIDFGLIPTAQPSLQIITKSIGKKVSIITSDSEIRHIWVPFHFLPGNYKSRLHNDPNVLARIKTYTGPKSYWWPTKWKYDARAEWQFKLLCLPQSPLVTSMINDITDNHKGKPYEIHLVGIKMHVLADTGAHMYYAGTPAWHVNDAGADVFDLTVSPKKKIRWVHPYNIIDIIAGEMASPPDLTYESYNYLGHGRMGHVPDYPWIKYEYTPKWSSQPIVKDNPSTYIQTFKEMVTAMKCIRENRQYNVLDTETIDKAVISAIDKILRHKYKLGDWYDKGVDFRCEVWKDAIKSESIVIGNKAVTMPTEYNAKAWYNEVKTSDKPIKETDYYKFNFAAVKHLTFVKNELEAEGIPL